MLIFFSSAKMAIRRYENVTIFDKNSVKSPFSVHEILFVRVNFAFFPHCDIGQSQKLHRLIERFIG